MTSTYRRLVGDDQARFRAAHPERRYYHSYTVEHRCKWCNLPAWGQTPQTMSCQVLVIADTVNIEQDTNSDGRQFDRINMWGTCTCGQRGCGYCDM